MPSIQSDQATVDGDVDLSRAGIDIQLRRYVYQMCLHGHLRNVELIRDRLVPKTLGDQLKHFQFARGRRLLGRRSSTRPQHSR
jgi:hypothetical protein